MVQAVRKAVFPVAGLCTRFLPATKAMPKEVLPIVDKPLIQYAVEEAVDAGATKLIFITGASKPEQVSENMEATQVVDSLTPEILERIIERVRKAGARPMLAGMKLPTNYGEDYREKFEAVFPALARKHKVPLMPFLLKYVAAVDKLNQAGVLAVGSDIVFAEPDRYRPR